MVVIAVPARGRVRGGRTLPTRYRVREDLGLRRGEPRRGEQIGEIVRVELAEPTVIFPPAKRHRDQKLAAGGRRALELGERAPRLASRVVGTRVLGPVNAVVHPNMLESREANDGLE